MEKGDTEALKDILIRLEELTRYVKTKIKTADMETGEDSGRD